MRRIKMTYIKKVSLHNINNNNNNNNVSSNNYAGQQNATQKQQRKKQRLILARNLYIHMSSSMKTYLFLV